MTDATTTPKRKPSGAAVAGAHPRPTLYPRQLVLMVTDEQADYVEALATSRGASKSEIGRELLDAGIKATTEVIDTPEEQAAYDARRAVPRRI